MKTKDIIRRLTVLVLAYIVAFTGLPVLAGESGAYAASVKRPAKVKGLTAEADGDNDIRLEWHMVSGARGYIIYRNGKKLKTVSAKHSCYDDTKVKAGKTYTYKIRAYKKYKQKQYYNRKTRKWQKKRIRGVKTRRVTKKRLGKMSNAAKATATGKTSGGSGPDDEGDVSVDSGYSNVGRNDYSVDSHVLNSYIVSTDSGFMKVQNYPKNPYINTSDTVKLTATYYDKDFNILSEKDIPIELPRFGAFYESANNYFICTGADNIDEKENIEVFRLTKYDKNWNRLGSYSGIAAPKMVKQFCGSGCRMEIYDDIMYVIDGCANGSARQGHQMSSGILIDTGSMTLVEYGQFGGISHSFNQFIKRDGEYMVKVEQGDAYTTRGIHIVKMGQYSPDNIRRIYGKGSAKLICFPGDSGVNYTGVSLGSLEVSDTRYLVAGSGVYRTGVTEDNFNNYRTKDIFIASIEKATMSEESINVNWLTNIPTSGENHTNATTPYLVKVENSKFMVVWTEGKKAKYLFIDGEGNTISDEYSFTGSLSDCTPILCDGRVVWYTTKNDKDTFYSISVNDPTDVLITK